jgi:hypothetical protein
MTYLATSLAHVRLLARVDARVNRQGTPLNELFAAAGMLADMGSDAAVDAFYTRISKGGAGGEARSDKP